MSEILERWTRAPNYIGETYYDYFVILGKHRDSDSLTRSNFDVALEMLGGESETVIIVRSSHWAVGWIEGLFVHESDKVSLEIAEEISESLVQYPVLDGEHWYSLQYNEICEYWEHASLHERIEICKDAHTNILASRRDYPSKKAFDYLRDTWH